MIPRRAWFAYEMNFDECYQPVIYYDELPAKPLGSRRERHNRILTVEITHLLPDENDPPFAQLQVLYPLKIREETVIREERKEKQMARPVQGFLTSQGKFFDTKEEADFYDASYELDVAIIKAAESLGIEDDAQTQSISKGIRDFITANAATIEELLSTRKALANVGKSDELDGPTADHNPTDDPPVRDEADSPVAQAAPTEDQPTRPRKNAKPG